MKMGAILFCVVIAIAFGALGALAGATWATKQLNIATDAQATLVIGFVASGIAILAAIVALWGVYSQRVLTRRQATIAHLAALEADEYVRATITAFIGLTRKDKNLAAYADADQQGSEDALTIISVLNQYELISTGVQHGIFEYELIWRWQRSSIKRFWEAANPFVVALRHRVGIPTLWCEFEKLHGWVSGNKSPLQALWWTGFG